MYWLIGTSLALGIAGVVAANLLFFQAITVGDYISAGIEGGFVFVNLALVIYNAGSIRQLRSMHRQQREFRAYAAETERIRRLWEDM